ncbi:cadmium ion transporter [Ceratobasidium sp. AG-Ba]|nr:cadmium ion transporter [Ceratobasidium sp. AG-Ba]QRW08059.1 cadmium ion transporter [Ceratobasidium sp. AG-Ba]
MPTYIVTTTGYSKPLPALPPLPYEARPRPNSLLFETSSTYSHASFIRARSGSSQSTARPRYVYESEGSISSNDSVEIYSRPRIPSILKSSNASLNDGSSTRNRSHSKSVRFLPIIDNLLRHTLHSRCVSHDLRFSPHSARLPSVSDRKLLSNLRHGAPYLALCEKTRAQPAVSPPVSQMWIVSYEFPWVIEHPRSEEKFVTIYDVLNTLWRNLQKPVVEAEWSKLSTVRQNEIRRTGLAAYTHEPSRVAVDSESARPGKSRVPIRAVRRIDWLGTYTRFNGLRKDDALIAERVEKPWMREATWGLVLEDNGFRYDDIGRMY